MSDLSFYNNKRLFIYAHYQVPENRITGCILLLHGYGEHSGRYQSLIESLTDKGYAVFTLDHQGHGNSEGLRGHVDDFDHFVEDAACLFESVHARYPEKPWFVMGQGLGANMAFQLGNLYPYDISGLILCAPAYFIHKNIPIVVREVAKNLVSVDPAIPVMRLNPKVISRNPAIVEAFLNDVLVYSGCIRASMVMCMQKAAESLRSMIKLVKVPFWLGHGTFDAFYDVAGSRELFKLASGVDKTLKIYEGLFHEILNEPESPRIIEEITEWTSLRLDQSTLEELNCYSRRPA